MRSWRRLLTLNSQLAALIFSVIVARAVENSIVLVIVIILTGGNLQAAWSVRLGRVAIGRVRERCLVADLLVRQQLGRYDLRWRRVLLQLG